MNDKVKDKFKIFNQQESEKLLEELIINLLLDPDDNYFLNILNLFNDNKQIVKFHKLLFEYQFDVQKNLNKKEKIIEKLKKEWYVDEELLNDDEKKIKSEISYNFLYSTLANYGTVITNLKLSQKIDIWEIFLNQNLKENHLAKQLFSCFLNHIDLRSNERINLFETKLNKLYEDTNLFFQSIDENILKNSYSLLHWLELIYNWGQVLFIYNYYSKNESNKIIENEYLNLKPKFNINFLHSYKSEKFWKKFISNAIQKEEKNSEIREWILKLEIQNVAYINSCSIKTKEFNNLKDEDLNSLKDYFLISPNLIFYINFEQIYNVFNEKQLEEIFIYIISNFFESKEKKYLKFLSQDYFFSSKKIQIIMTRAFLNSNYLYKTDEIEKSKNFVKFLKKISKKTKNYSIESFLTYNKEDELWIDLKELSENINNLMPSNYIKNEIVENLVNFLDSCLSLNNLIPGCQCLITIFLFSFSISFYFDKKSVELISNLFYKVFETQQQIRLFDIYSSDLFIKKFLIFLNFTNLTHFDDLLNLIIFKIMIRNTFLKEFKEILIFLLKIETKNDDKIDELVFVLRIKFLNQLFIFADNKKKFNKSLVNWSKDNEDILMKNINNFINQFEKRINKSNYEKINLVNCLQTIFLVKKNHLNWLSKKFNCDNYFEKSIKITFEGISLSIQNISSIDVNLYLNYLFFLFKNESLFKLSKKDLIEKIWNDVIFNPLGLKNDKNDLNDISIDLPNYDLFIENLEKDNLKRKSNYNKLSFKKIKPMNSEISKEIILNLVKNTINHCNYEQLINFIQILSNDLIEFNSNFIDDNFDYKILDKKKKIFILLKEIFLNLKCLQTNKKSDLFKDEMNNLVKEIVNFSRILYFLKLDLKIQIDKELDKEEELKNNLDLIYEIQFLILICVETMLSESKHFGHFTTQQVNYLMNICILSDLNNCLDDTKHFSNIFNGIYLILNRVFIDYNFTVISAISAYTNLVNNLMQNICKISFQIKFSSLQSKTQFDIEKCSINFQNLLILLSKTKDYSHCTINLIAIFIKEMQNNVVYSTIKNRILIGIYKLLNTFNSENKFQMIYTRLNQEGRQMFKTIYENYEQFYKFKGYV